MARVTHVKKAQQSKRSRVCKTCGKPIEVGTAYKWFATRIGHFSQRKDYHAGCAIPRSHTTTSDKLGQLYDAQDAIDQAHGYGKDDIAAALEEAADVADQVASEYEESADNIVEGFGHETMQSEEIREKAEICTAWGDVLRDAASEVENLGEDDLDGDEIDQEVADELGVENYADDDSWTDHPDYEDTRATIIENKLAELAQEKAQDASGELEL